MTSYLHITTFLQGGAGRIVTALALAQRASGRRVFVALTRTPEPGYESYAEYLDTLTDAGVDLVFVDSTFKRDAALNDAACRAVAAALDGCPPSLVHTHAGVPSRIALALRASGTLPTPTPIVQTMHGWSLGKDPAHAVEDLRALASVDLAVFPSRASLAQLRGLGAGFKATAVVPCGIPNAPPREPAASTPLRRTRRIMTIGSLTTQKNQQVVIDAFPLVARHHDVELTLVGEGPELERLASRAGALGMRERVTFVGYQPNAADWLGRADVLVQPSLTESFGLAVLEAFRAGVPVVASRIAALTELVVPGDTGWTFDAASATSLAFVLDRALAAPPPVTRTVVQRARQAFEARYTVERMVEGYGAVYRAALEARASERVALVG